MQSCPQPLRQRKVTHRSLGGKRGQNATPASGATTVALPARVSGGQPGAVQLVHKIERWQCFTSCGALPCLIQQLGGIYNPPSPSLSDCTYNVQNIFLCDNSTGPCLVPHNALIPSIVHPWCARCKLPLLITNFHYGFHPCNNCLGGTSEASPMVKICNTPPVSPFPIVHVMSQNIELRHSSFNINHCKFLI